jgi:hypothetical protein
MMGTPAMYRDKRLALEAWTERVIGQDTVDRVLAVLGVSSKRPDARTVLGRIQRECGIEHPPAPALRDARNILAGYLYGLACQRAKD